MNINFSNAETAGYVRQLQHYMSVDPQGTELVKVDKNTINLFRHLGSFNIKRLLKDKLMFLSEHKQSKAFFPLVENRKGCTGAGVHFTYSGQFDLD